MCVCVVISRVGSKERVISEMGGVRIHSVCVCVCGYQ